MIAITKENKIMFWWIFCVLKLRCQSALPWYWYCFALLGCVELHISFWQHNNLDNWCTNLLHMQVHCQIENVNLAWFWMHSSNWWISTFCAPGRSLLFPPAAAAVIQISWAHEVTGLPADLNNRKLWCFLHENEAHFSGTRSYCLAQASLVLLRGPYYWILS